MDRPEVSLLTGEVQMATVMSHDTESVPRLLTNIRLSDLYNLPGESVAMNSEIFCAMRAGNTKFVEKMKSYETPMTCFKNEKGDTILHVAASFGRLELVKSIIFECPSLLLELNWEGRIPLHVAARAGHLAVVEILAGSIACLLAQLPHEDRERLNPYVVKDINGDTPLHSALKYLQEETELLEKQRIRSQGILLDNIMYWRCRRISKYFSKASKRIMETAIFLVSVNQCVSFLANKDGISPLYLAVKAGNLSLVKAMLSRLGNNILGESSNLASQLEGRRSLVHVALKAKNTDVLNVILHKYPSLVNERDDEGETCISVGASVGFYKGICMLLDLSTSGVFECDNDGSFPIHKAVEESHEDIVKMILRRCPDSLEQLNRKGQNILHIAAKSGRCILYLLTHINKFGTRNHLMEEQDVDGNTPLHLATLKWRPLTVEWIITVPSNKTKLLDIQNNDGLRPLDIAHLNLQSDYVFRERMTLMLLLCVYKPKGVAWIPTSGMTLKSILNKKVSDEKFKDRINVLLLVAALVATVTFAAGFTMPGGFNSSPPNIGMAILEDNYTLAVFLVCDTLAMQFSLVAIVALVWAQLGDQELAHRAFHLALPSLFFALYCMSFAFLCGVVATIKINRSLAITMSAITWILTGVMTLLLTPYVIPQLHGIPFLEYIIKWYLYLLLMLVNEEDSEILYISDPGHSDPAFLKRVFLRIKNRLPSFK